MGLVGNIMEYEWFFLDNHWVYIKNIIKLIAKVKYRDNTKKKQNKRVRLRKKKINYNKKKNKKEYLRLWMIAQWKKGKHNTNNIYISGFHFHAWKRNEPRQSKESRNKNKTGSY